MLRDLLAGRELAWQLATRDIKTHYRQAALGLLWAFIIPLSHTATWIFMQSSGIVTLQPTPLPYPVYVFTGTLLWSIFMDATNAPLQQTLAARPMLSKINFPREALILSGIYQTLFNAAIKVAVLLALLPLIRLFPDWRLLLFPLGLLALVLAGTALGLLITPVGMLYSDIGKGLPLILQFVMYFTPVVFPMPKSGWAATLFDCNPLTPIILTSRELLTGFPPTHLGTIIAINLALALSLCLIWSIYRVAIPIFVERMGA